jgi:two-component system, NarL family, response regulator DegU
LQKAHLNMAKIKIGIVDDHNLFRKGLASILSQKPDIEVVLQASSGQELLDILHAGKTLKPEIILLDIQMPDMDGIIATKHLKRGHPKIKIIMLTMHDEEKFVTNLINMGVNGYLLKDTEPDEVERALKEVSEGRSYFGPIALSVIQKRMSEPDLIQKRPSRPMVMTENFSPKELEVLKLICQEYTTAEIADRLCLSARTIEGYRNRLIKKTHSKNSAGIVAYAIENKLLD